MISEAQRHVAEVSREDGWWLIDVPSVDAVTQAHSWTEVEVMARDLVVGMLDLDDDAQVDLEIVPVFDDESARGLRDADQDEAAAIELLARAADRRRSAVLELRGQGWTLQAIAHGLGLSHQRVDQIARSSPAPAGHAPAIDVAESDQDRLVTGRAGSRAPRRLPRFRPASEAHRRV